MYLIGVLIATVFSLVYICIVLLDSRKITVTNLVIAALVCACSWFTVAIGTFMLIVAGYMWVAEEGDNITIFKFKDSNKGQ